MSRVTRAPVKLCILLAMSIIAMILEAIATPSPRTAAALRQDRASIDLAALQARVAEIETNRKRLLLAGSNEALRTNDDALADARIDVERGAALIEELDRLAAQAEAREAAAALKEDEEAAKREADKFAEIVREIDELADRIRDLLAVAAVSSAAVVRWNARAVKVPAVSRLPAIPLEVVRRRVLDKVT